MASALPRIAEARRHPLRQLELLKLDSMPSLKVDACSGGRAAVRVLAGGPMHGY
jgi:hypothetical protein